MRRPADLERALLRWFDRERRDLPWRRTRDAYAIWLSEVMLQQTQVSTVIPYWHRFLARFPDVGALAAAPLEEVLSQWKGLGYYSRARNLHRAAQAIVEHHGGQLPRELEALRALPGFGRYTAGAVASIAFGVKAPLVDGNVARVFSRLFELEGATGDRAREARLWATAEAHVSTARPGDWNQALMELGATVCLPKGARCDACPLASACGARASGRVEQLPPPKVRAARKVLRWAVAVCERRGKLLWAQRPAEGLFGGLWELPSAELGRGESPTEGLTRVLGPRLELGELLGRTHRVLTHRELKLELFRARLSGRPRTGEYRALRWVSEAELPALAISTAMRAALARVRRSGG